jgi:hypothetical protein
MCGCVCMCGVLGGGAQSEESSQTHRGSHEHTKNDSACNRLTTITVIVVSSKVQRAGREREANAAKRSKLLGWTGLEFWFKRRGDEGCDHPQRRRERSESEASDEVQKDHECLECRNVCVCVCVCVYEQARTGTRMQHSVRLSLCFKKRRGMGEWMNG